MTSSTGDAGEAERTSEAGGTERRYRVVLNDEEQYSIWAEGRPNPAGWYDAGFAGTEAECLAHIDQVWVDMRPRSLREAMEGG